MPSPSCYLFIDRYNLLRYDSAIEVLDISSAGCWLCMPKRLFECDCQCFGIMGTYSTAPGMTDDLGDIAYIRGDDGYIASHCFFYDVRRPFSNRREQECVARVH